MDMKVSTMSLYDISVPISFFSILLLLFGMDGVSAQINDPAVFYTTIELVCSDGYPVQEHKVLTEDGYILTIHRIPNGRRRVKVPRRSKHYQKLHNGYHPDFALCVNESIYETPVGPPLLLSHGLFSASDNFVLQGPGFDLAYLLADAGYDVWLTNVRGNFYSRRHVSLKPFHSKFWDFSFHEMGIYDMPATIDYILELTGHQKLTYVGHSMGTTMFFIMTSTKPEYNNKINFFVGMTPVSEIKQEHFSKERNSTFLAGYQLVKELKKRRSYELFPRTTLANILSRSTCFNGSPFQDFCYDIFFSVFGHHSKLFLRKKLILFITHALSGASTKIIDHYAQFFNSPFAQFDYGPEENLRRYGQYSPPNYDYKKITVPIALYYSKGDYVVDSKDVQILVNNLPNLVEAEEFSKYSHVDFVWAYNAKDLLYPKILSIIDQFRYK